MEEASQAHLVRIAFRGTAWRKKGEKHSLPIFACKTTFHKNIKLSDVQSKNSNK